MKLTKEYYKAKGAAAFESGRRIAAWSGSYSWQHLAFKEGYELQKAWSILYADSPEEYQANKLKEIIK